MHRMRLSEGMTPVDPDPLLLEQMTARAAASVPTRHWWQRMTARTGAAAVAGALLVSGAAYAERTHLMPLVKPIIPVLAHPAQVEPKHATVSASTRPSEEPADADAGSRAATSHRSRAASNEHAAHAPGRAKAKAHMRARNGRAGKAKGDVRKATPVSGAPHADHKAGYDRQGAGGPHKAGLR